MRIDPTDEDMYLVVWYREEPILTNVLRATAKFKAEVGGWPRTIGIRDGNRMPFGFGDDTQIYVTTWMVLGAMYMSTYRPYPDDPKGKLTPVEFKGKRVPAIAKTSLFRSRRNA